MNIITESKKSKEIASINDCLKKDHVTIDLWFWAERLEKLGKILFWLTIIGGILIAFVTSYDYYRDNLDSGVLLLGIAKTALYAFIEYCTYHVLALLIGALASITQHTKATAKLTEYMARKTLNEEYVDDNADNEDISKSEKTVEAYETKDCPECSTSQNANNEKCWSCGHQFDN